MSDLWLKRIPTMVLALLFVLLLSGCRVRTTPGSGADARGTGAGSGEAQAVDPDTLQEHAAGISPDDAEAEMSGEASPGGATVENPEAARKEFDENAAAEIVPGTERAIHEAGEADGAGRTDPDAEASAALLSEDAEETATQTVPAQEAEQVGVSDEAEMADSLLYYYTVLLEERSGSLFECKRLTVYWETTEDHVTVFKTSPEHQLILSAGAYDVSARLLEENLRVDDGWVVRKNPGVIVKIVDSGTLGSGVHSPAAAESACARLLARPEWQGIDAVRSGRVLLLSEDLLDAPYLQTAAMLMIAKTANPELYEDVDVDQALQGLIEEATGSIPDGIYYYNGQR